MKQYYLQQILSTIFYISNKIQSEGDKLNENLTVRQWMTLLAVMHLPKDKASYNQIADIMGYSKQNAKKLVSILEKKGFVTISKSKTDNRAVNVTIAENCKDFLREYYKNGNDHLNKMFDYFDEEELKLLWSLLKKFAAYDGSNWTGYEKRVPID